MTDVRANVFANLEVSKEHKFGSVKTKIRKLSPVQITQVRKLNEELNKAVPVEGEQESDKLELVYETCRLGCPDMAELDNDFLAQLPLDELRKMSDEILVYSGLVAADDTKKA